MLLLLAEDYDDLSRIAARLVADALGANPRASVSVPTGATPTGFYRELAALHTRDAFDTSQLRVFQLDEYLGAAPENSRSFASWITRVFLIPLSIAAHQVVWLPGDSADPDAMCRQYDAAMQAVGGLDLVVLGLGENGHIGFNEPPADPAAPTRVVRLTDETRAANTIYWSAEPVPHSAITCGMAQILAAKTKLVLVSGRHKREILERALYAPMTPDVPASYLQCAEGVTIIADRVAAPPQSLVGAVSSAGDTSNSA